MTHKPWPMEPAVPETEAALPEDDAAAGDMAVAEVEYLDDDKALYIYDEGLTSLDDYKLVPDLLQLGVSDNKLTGLDLSKNTRLRELHCSGNRIAVLDLSNCKGVLAAVQKGKKHDVRVRAYKKVGIAKYYSA